ncbi:MAG: HAMP domain-containing histidine kinase [Ardenticatenaceae bacterium]|nr:HAMP domain-containing histidine kinase [Anaerolineales bacterium]MCB8973011.1 HAMP domain-containing histidine kinase [Ardenticatenaceae bacterium]
MFLGFLAILGLIVLLVAGGMTIFALLLTRRLGGTPDTAVLVWVSGCGLALALPLLAVVLAVRTFRRVANPLAAIMNAADAVAEGDLSVRVPEFPRRNEFTRLAHSFNNMTAELERADQQRRNLTADVAHELRTPLHIIQGNLEGVLDGVYEPTPEHIEATLDETRLLARLVEDLHTLSLADAGQLPLKMEPVDVADLLADVATSFSVQAVAQGVELGVETAVLPPNTHIQGDAGRLDQVLSNLVVNALRHTPGNGRITLSAKLVDENVQIQVTDTGEGISEEDLPFVFERFWRGDRARTHSGGAGGGLGLAIVKQMVVAHGGQISVSSVPQQATIFTLNFPVVSMEN